MGFVVLPALVSDIEKVYDIYFAAFGNDLLGSLMLKILFPGGITKEFRDVHTRETLRFWQTCPFQYTMKCVDTDTGEIVGMALGDILFHERTAEERQRPAIGWLQGEAQERAEKVVGRLWEAHEKVLGGRRHIYGHVVAVRPDRQGQKAGAALVQWGIDTSNATGLPLYFEASPSTYKLYEKMGFETLPETVVHKAEDVGTDADVEVPLMVRMPSSAGITFAEWRQRGFSKP